MNAFLDYGNDFWAAMCSTTSIVGLSRWPKLVRLGKRGPTGNK